jgi:hypothetical protein
MATSQVTQVVSSATILIRCQGLLGVNLASVAIMVATSVAPSIYAGLHNAKSLQYI